MKFNELDTDVHQLEHSIGLINQELKDVMSAGRGLLCGSCEFFFVGVARRTGASTRAFSLAVRDDNHFVAPALIRLNLEHLLVLHAGTSYQTGDLHDFTTELMKGKRPRDLRNTAGNKMTERVLVESLGQKLDRITNSNVQDLYKWCNNFTHFGTPFLYSSMPSLDDSGHFDMLLVGTTFEIPAVQSTDVKKWVQAMETINLLVRHFLSQWRIKRDEMYGA